MCGTFRQTFVLLKPVVSALEQLESGQSDNPDGETKNEGTLDKFMDVPFSPSASCCDTCCEPKMCNVRVCVHDFDALRLKSKPENIQARVLSN